jgi:hypothetical protein
MHQLLAYLDPGSGSMIVQLLIGTVAGGALAISGGIKRAVNSIKSRFARNKDDNSAQ